MQSSQTKSIRQPMSKPAAAGSTDGETGRAWLLVISTGCLLAAASARVVQGAAAHPAASMRPATMPASSAEQGALDRPAAPPCALGYLVEDLSDRRYRPGLAGSHALVVFIRLPADRLTPTPEQYADWVARERQRDPTGIVFPRNRCLRTAGGDFVLVNADGRRLHAVGTAQWTDGLILSTDVPRLTWRSYGQGVDIPDPLVAPVLWSVSLGDLRAPYSVEYGGSRIVVPQKPLKGPRQIRAVMGGQFELYRQLRIEVPTQLTRLPGGQKYHLPTGTPRLAISRPRSAAPVKRPTAAERLYERGTLFLDHGMHAAARQAFTELLKQHPEAEQAASALQRLAEIQRKLAAAGSDSGHSSSRKH